MSNTITMLNGIVLTVTQFIAAHEDLKLISDRIGADSSLSAALAAQAAKSNRTDLTTADFDNLKAAIDAVTAFLNSHSNLVNSDTVRLPFYKVM